MCKKIPLTERKIEVTTIYEDRAFCKGEGHIGHPGVFLDLSKKGRAVCPYCSQVFENVKRLGQEKR